LSVLEHVDERCVKRFVRNEGGHGVQKAGPWPQQPCDDDASNHSDKGVANDARHV
jgi:hypothetical protein